MHDKLKDLFEGMELSEEFKTKVSDLLESAVQEKTTEIEKQMEEKYSDIAESYSEYVVSEMEDKTEQYIQEEVLPAVERYTDYVAEQFIKENKMVIESETKVELADKFLSGFSAIAEQYNVEVPAGQDDIVSGLKDQLKEAQEHVDNLLKEKGQLEESILEDRKQDMVVETAEGLTDTQKERFTEAATEIKYHSDDQFCEALKELKESFYPVSGKDEAKDDFIKEDLEDDKGTDSIQDPWMKELFSRI